MLTFAVLVCYFHVCSHLYPLHVLSECFQEDELLKSISSCKAESNVLTMWINFLEDTWNIQCLHRENKEKEVKYVFYWRVCYFSSIFMVILELSQGLFLGVL